MTTTRRANVVADTTILTTFPKAAFKVASWDHAHSPATQKTVRKYCDENALIMEPVYDAARRCYVVFVYHSTAYAASVGRRNCFATICQN